MSLDQRPPDRDEPHGLKRAISGVVGELVGTAVLIALIVLVMVVFRITSLLYDGVLVLLGTPDGAFGAALGLTWFGGSLALIGLLCVMAWRGIGFIGLRAGFASNAADDQPETTAEASRASAPEKGTDADVLRVNGRPVPWNRRKPGRKK